MKRIFKKHDLQVINASEDDRLESIAIAKLRGKGPPKKKREKDCELRSENRIDTMLIRVCATSDEGKEKEEVNAFGA